MTKDERAARQWFETWDPRAELLAAARAGDKDAQRRARELYEQTERVPDPDQSR